MSETRIHRDRRFSYDQHPTCGYETATHGGKHPAPLPCLRHLTLLAHGPPARQRGGTIKEKQPQTTSTSHLEPSSKLSPCAGFPVRAPGLDQTSTKYQAGAVPAHADLR